MHILFTCLLKYLNQQFLLNVKSAEKFGICILRKKHKIVYFRELKSAFEENEEEASACCASASASIFQTEISEFTVGNSAHFSLIFFHSLCLQFFTGSYCVLLFHLLPMLISRVSQIRNLLCSFK